MSETSASPPCIDQGRAKLPRAWQPAWRFRPAFLAGRGNRVEGSGAGAALLKMTTLFYGPSSRNTVRIGPNFRTHGLVIKVEGADNHIEIGADVRLSGDIALRGFGLRLTVGDRCDIKKSRIIASEANIAIGSDCLVASGTLIRTSDMHTIVDRSTGARINAPCDVVIGNGVWIAAEAALLKGARVGNGCVVGFRSVLTSSFEEDDCLLGGAPARVLRRDISWTR